VFPLCRPCNGTFSGSGPGTAPGYRDRFSWFGDGTTSVRSVDLTTSVGANNCALLSARMLRHSLRQTATPKSTSSSGASTTIPAHRLPCAAGARSSVPSVGKADQGTGRTRCGAGFRRTIRSAPGTPVEAPVSRSGGGLIFLDLLHDECLACARDHAGPGVNFVRCGARALSLQRFQYLLHSIEVHHQGSQWRYP
jgi:hypothetical protein